MEVTIKINSVRRKKPPKANKLTQVVFGKTDKGEELIKCKDIIDFLNKLGI